MKGAYQVKGLYVVGGKQKRRLLKEHEEWDLYDSALVLQLRLETNEATVCVEYSTPLDARPSASSSVLFKAATQQGNRLYVCTSTEVLVYKVPEFEPVCYVSLPCFNDLHHVCPTDEGNLLVANTGLDMVVEFTQQGEVLRQWNVLGEDPWGRFSTEVDYRKVATTKPHRSHPNYVFQRGTDIWVTRYEQRDAVCLTRSAPPIVIGIENVHDGHVEEDRIYFTTVDGNLVLVDRETLKVSNVVDLKLIDNECRALLGWCRGLMILDEAKVWVGFTRVRKTRFKENLNWVKHVFHDVEKPTHLALYDLSARKCLREIDLEPYGMNVVYSIFPAVEALPRAGPFAEEKSSEPLAEVAQ
jgi:hypothetical protein